MTEFTVRNEKAKTLTIVPTFELASRYIKHHVPDGDYSVVGPNYDCTIERVNGVLYPTSGTFNGQKIPPRSKVEARQVFGDEDPYRHRSQVIDIAKAIVRASGLSGRRAARTLMRLVKNVERPTALLDELRTIMGGSGPEKRGSA